MPTSTPGATPDTPATAPVDADLTRTYALVLVVEFFVILFLYWLGRNFS